VSLESSPAIASIPKTNMHPEFALILGATQGIGLGFVQRLLQQSNISKVFATYRTLEAAGELLALQMANPDRLICLTLDITEESQIVDLVQTIQTQTKQLHWVINCIGVLHEDMLQPEKSLSQINPEKLLRYFQVNSIGAVLLAKHLVPLLRHGDRSIFATISAKVGSIGDNQLGGWYGYRASKAALNMFMRTTAIEYGRKSPNTIIALLHPGTTDTRLSQPFQRNVPPEKLFSIERTVAQLWAVLDRLEPASSGQFFSWNGEILPW
jgi:NAD(P)-dependent dehydrogenase (short-subunit alcohol dehydrogenase family)